MRFSYRPYIVPTGGFAGGIRILLITCRPTLPLAHSPLEQAGDCHNCLWRFMKHQNSASYSPKRPDVSPAAL